MSDFNFIGCVTLTEPCSQCGFAAGMHGAKDNGCPSSDGFSRTAFFVRYKRQLITCECGSDKCGLPTHSSWCPRYVKI